MTIGEIKTTKVVKKSWKTIIEKNRETKRVSKRTKDDSKTAQKTEWRRKTNKERL